MKQNLFIGHLIISRINDLENKRNILFHAQHTKAYHYNSHL